MTLDEWLETVPRVLREGPGWRVRAYQIGSYLGALVLGDVEPLANDPRFHKLVAQLLDAVGSIPANVAEGYARRSRSDRIRFYEYAFGSANEAQSRYLGLRPVLGADLVTERLELLARVNQLLLVMISNERKGMTWGTNRRMPPELSREAPQSPEPQPDPPPAVHPDA